ncbi:MAG: hypothetical protein JXR41_10130 [Bacteroidales bacterium]|nr:hypothetical protein [Bacteroidales bacterium]
MSLFIDVIEVLSDKVKSGLIDVIGQERKNQGRPIRKICDICSKYLDYRDYRYDKVEKAIHHLQETGQPGNPLYTMLLAVLNDSLDEDSMAIEQFTAFSDTPLADPFRTELADFITIGRFVTLKDYDFLETAGSIMVERYTNEDDITDTLSNLYLKADSEEFIPVFQRLLDRARKLYPESLSLEGLNGFINMKGRDYRKALESYLAIKDRLEADKDDPYYNDQLAATWDNIAACYLKLEDVAKTLESCDIALEYDKNAATYRVGNPILYKKAEALLLTGEKEQALAIVDTILNENQEDEKALEIKGRINE